jgi:hypothetical protein
VRLWPAWFDREDLQPRWAWRGIGFSVTLLLLATASTVLVGLVVLILLAAR